MKIFLLDLIPGGEKYQNKRAHSNFTPFPPFDKRNIAAGRLGDEFNAVIVYSKEKLLKYDSAYCDECGLGHGFEYPLVCD